MALCTIFLTSCGFINDSIKKAFMNELPKNFSKLKVGIITTASEQKEKNPFAIKVFNDFMEMGFTQIIFMDIEKEQVNLEDFSIIYLNGGNPFRLLYFIKLNNLEEAFTQFCKKEKFLIGVSAGAIILGPTLQLVHDFTPQLNTYLKQELTGLSITDSCIFPHYDRSDLFGTSPTIEQRIQTFEKQYNKAVIRLKDEDFRIEKIKEA